MKNCKCDCIAHNGFLTAKGLAEAAQREVFLDGVDNMDMFGYLDSTGSVSALVEPPEPIWVDQLLENQYRRFLGHA